MYRDKNLSNVLKEDSRVVWANGNINNGNIISKSMCICPRDT